MSILRFDFGFDAELSDHGKYVEYEDHLAALAAKNARLALIQRAVEWLLDSTVTRNSEGQLVNWCGPGRVEIAADFAEIINVNP